MEVVTTWCPFRRYPLRTTLRPSVTFAVKVTYRESPPACPPKKEASFSLAVVTMSRVPMSRRAAEPLARLAPPPVRNSYMARGTHSGFGHVVAPLLRYIAIFVSPLSF
jgi:hypothetical protein